MVPKEVLFFESSDNLFVLLSEDISLKLFDTFWYINFFSDIFSLCRLFTKRDAYYSPLTNNTTLLKPDL